MKRDTPQHPKIDALMDHLNIPRYAVIGLLESLWHICAANTPRGDIGRYTNSAIARRIEWDRDADELIAALIATNWLDEHLEHRLLVHDWSEHADDSVNLKLGRLGETFADGLMPNLRRMSKDEREKCYALLESKLDTACTQNEHAVHTAPPSHTQSLPKPGPPPSKPSPQARPADGVPGALREPGAGTGGSSELEKAIGMIEERIGLHAGVINSLLIEAGIDSEQLRKDISQRRDLTPDLVGRVIEATRSDSRTKDPPKLIAHRLSKWTQSKLEKIVQSP